MTSARKMEGVEITGLYTDAHTNDLNTDVYSNGKMQVVVYPTVMNTGSATEDEVKDYVAKNTNIFVLKDTGGKRPLDTSKWIKSNESNDYLHDINRGAKTEFFSAEESNNIRVPLYFIVPVNLAGKYKWCAELDGRYTQTVVPVIVNIHKLSVTGYDFQIGTLREGKNKAELKFLNYNDKTLPSNHQLIKPLAYKGLNFHGNTCWITVLRNENAQHACGGFLSYKKSSASLAKKSKTYQPSEFSLIESSFPHGRPLMTNDGPWDAIESFTSNEIDNAWLKGIVMFNVPYLKVLPDPRFPNSPLFLESQGIEVEDNFGNSLRLEFNWDNQVGGNLEMWSVASATVL